MYQLTQTSSVVRLGDGALIPADPDNRDYEAYQRWLSAGNTPVPYVAPEPALPQVLTRRQALLALLAAGKLDQVELVIQSAPRAVQIAWEAAGTFERDNPLIESIAPQVGLSEQDVDNLFIQAAAL